MHLAILGASGHGKVVADTAELLGWGCVNFFDDAWPELQCNGPWAVQGGSDQLLENLSAYDGVVVAIGNNRIRSEKQFQLTSAGAKIVSVVHPSAVISDRASIGVGTVVFANAVVNAGTKVGHGCIVNTGAVVEHDCVLGDYSHISPNAVLAGGSELGASAWLGANASVRQLIKVGDHAVVGMGAVVINDVPDDITVVGNPAKILRSPEPQNDSSR